MNQHNIDHELTANLELVAIQEVARALRDMRGAVVDHLHDERLTEGDAPRELSSALLGLLMDAAVYPERYGLDAYGLRF